MKNTSTNKQKIVLAGGSGFLGQHLTRHFLNNGFQVYNLTRNPKSERDIYWDGEHLGEWKERIENAFAVINLAGKSVDCRYTEKNKAAILQSRLRSTHILGEAIQQCNNKPAIWINSSTSTIYEDTRGTNPANTEQEGIIGDDFSMNVAKKWEQTFFEHPTNDITKVALRTAIVLGKDGGAFAVMKKLGTIGLCSPQGSGEQWISWIHVEDFCRAVAFILKNPTKKIFNLCAPNPVTNKVFNGVLKQQLSPMITIPQPEWMLKLGAFFIRTETELILKSRKVYPQHLLDAGFSFKYDMIEHVIASLTGKA